MTQSYFESLGRASSRPPDISKTNYLEEEPTEALVDAKNKEIDKAIKDSEAFHKANIEMYNAAHAQKMENINALINFMPKAKQLFEKRQEFADDRAELNRLRGIGQNLETDALEAQADTYNDELGVAISGEQGRLEVDGAPYELVNVAAAESITTPQQNIRNSIDKETQLFGSYLAESKRTLKLDDGRGYYELLTTDDYKNWYDTHAAIMLRDLHQKYPDVTERLLIKKWLPAYEENRKSYLLNVANTQNAQAKSAFDTNNKIKLWDSTQAEEGAGDALFGPTGYIKRRAAYFEHFYPGEGMKFARQEMVASIKEGVKEEYVTTLDFLDEEFIANDGSRTTFQKKFPREAAEIRGEWISQQNQRYTEQEERLEAAKSLWESVNIDDFDGVKDYDWMQSTAKAFREKFQTTDYPEKLKTAYTESYEDEFEKVKRLAHVAAQGGTVTLEDVSTLQNPTLKEKAMKLVEQTSLAGVPKEIETDSKEFIKANIAQYTFENDLSKAQTPKFKAIERQAYKAFTAKYGELKNQNQSDAVAQRGAEEHVLKQIKANEFDALPKYVYDTTGAYDINVARTALKIDPQLIYSNVAMAGEAPYLAQAETYFKSDYKKGSIPEYYKLLSQLYPDLDPHDLAKTRLENVGLLKEDTKSAYDGVNNPRLLTDKNTSSKTIRSAFTDKNMDWLLNRIENPAQKEHGGYEAIKNRNGQYVELPKRLTEHTIGEVLGLIQQGYTNFGMYDMTGSGLLQVLASGSMPFELDDMFDEGTQKAIVLGRLRYKNQQGKALNGLPIFRRLVNIPKAEREEFYKIVGDVPPMNQLDNLLPAVAKAVVEATLQ